MCKSAWKYVKVYKRIYNLNPIKSKSSSCCIQNFAIFPFSIQFLAPWSKLYHFPIFHPIVCHLVKTSPFSVQFVATWSKLCHFPSNFLPPGQNFAIFQFSFQFFATWSKLHHFPFSVIFFCHLVKTFSYKKNTKNTWCYLWRAQRVQTRVSKT